MGLFSRALLRRAQPFGSGLLFRAGALRLSKPTVSVQANGDALLQTPPDGIPAFSQDQQDMVPEPQARDQDLPRESPLENPAPSLSEVDNTPISKENDQEGFYGEPNHESVLSGLNKHSLLGRARIFLSSSSPALIGDKPKDEVYLPFPEFDIDEASGAIDALPLSLEYPVRLFDLLKDMLSMSRAALLFHDDASGLYAPIGIDGFDATSQRRLRIPADMLMAYVDAAPLRIEGQDLAAFSLFLSSNDFAQTDSIRLIPLKMDSALPAFLFSVDPPEAFTKDENGVRLVVPREWPMVQAFVCERLYIYNERFGLSFRSSSPRAYDQELEETFSTIESGKLSAKLCVMSLCESVSALIQETPQAEPFRMYREVFRLISRMVAKPGLLIPLGKQRVAMILAAPKPIDTELVIHQISLALQRILSRPKPFALDCELQVDLGTKPRQAWADQDLRIANE